MNILIIEDDPFDLAQLTSILHQWEDQSGITLKIFPFSSAEEFFASPSLCHADLCLFDIQFSNIPDSGNTNLSNGIDAARKLRKLGYETPVVFLTSHHEYVFDGYKVHAIDYLLKPVSLETIAPCLNEIHQKMQNRFYLFRNHNTIYQIPYDDIISIESMLHSIQLTTVNQIYEQRSTLDEALSHLPAQFIRCHRAYIINMSHIISMSRTEIQLSNRKKISIGRSYYPDVFQRFSDYTQHLI